MEHGLGRFDHEQNVHDDWPVMLNSRGFQNVCPRGKIGSGFNFLYSETFKCRIIYKVVVFHVTIKRMVIS